MPRPAGLGIGLETQFWFTYGTPGVKTQVLKINEIYWVDRHSSIQHHLRLDATHQILLQQVLLSDMQCHVAMAMLPELITDEYIISKCI